MNPFLLDEGDESHDVDTVTAVIALRDAVRYWIMTPTCSAGERAAAIQLDAAIRAAGYVRPDDVGAVSGGLAAFADRLADAFDDRGIEGWTIDVTVRNAARAAS